MLRLCSPKRKKSRHNAKVFPTFWTNEEERDEYRISNEKLLAFDDLQIRHKNRPIPGPKSGPKSRSNSGVTHGRR